MGRWVNPVWLNKAKMAALGFDVVKFAATSENDRRHKAHMSKEVLLVLEINGLAYQ